MPKKILFAFLISLVVTGCSKSYDDSGIWKQVNENTDRIAALEQQISLLNSEIRSLRSLFNSLEGNITIQDVVTTDRGYTIYFSDGTSAEIHHGAQGADGRPGADGQPGADAPLVGVAEFEGVYYWTITVNGYTTWLLDDSGNKMRVTGADAAAGEGVPGQNGAYGTTPLIAIDKDGYWTVSYDNGATYVYVLGADGNPVKAEKPGDVVINSVFMNVEIYQAHIVFTLLDGSTFSIPIDSRISLVFTGTDNLNGLGAGKTRDIPFTVYGADRRTHVEVSCDVSVSASVSYNPGDGQGTVHVTMLTAPTDYTKVLVFLCNEYKTLTYVLSHDGSVGGQFEDERIPTVIPEDVIDNLKGHMPIHDGVEPPVIEGSYVIDQMTCLYCSDSGGYPPGAVVTPTYIRFMNQDLNLRTIDYEEKEGNATAVGLGAYISGKDSKFTAYFNTDGISSDGTKYKTALVISGQKTDQGIKDIYYAFVMVEKSAPGNLMEVAGYRIFYDGDGLAVNAAWESASRGAMPEYMSKYAFVK